LKKINQRKYNICGIVNIVSGSIKLGTYGYPFQKKKKTLILEEQYDFGKHPLLDPIPYLLI